MSATDPAGPQGDTRPAADPAAPGGEAEEAAGPILVAGVGNSWLTDDAFGGRLAARLAGEDLPEGIKVADFGTGGLDLAYEAMRGYSALVILDVSRQGGEPGTLYVMEPDLDEIGPIEGGEVINPHGMDPQTVLRFLKTVGGAPSRVVVVACEPAEVEEMSLEMSPAIEAAIERAVGLVVETLTEMRGELTEAKA